MKVTRTMLVMMLFLGGCGGCEHSESVPGSSSAPAPVAATAGAAKASGTAPAKIQAGSAVEPTVAHPTPREGAGGAPAGGAPAQPPQPDSGAAPEPMADEDDCIVVADANPDYGPPPLVVAFSAEAECSGGTPKYDWDFGDGAAHSNEANPSHSYAKAGEYTATVTVTGKGDATADDEIDVTVEEGDGAE